MRCPYLSNATKKVCVKMLEAQVSEDLNDFDIRHFCDGDPVYCYYFRLPQLQKTQPIQPEKENFPSLLPNTQKKLFPSLKELLLKPNENP